MLYTHKVFFLTFCDSFGDSVILLQTKDARCVILDWAARNFIIRAKVTKQTTTSSISGKINVWSVFKDREIALALDLSSTDLRIALMLETVRPLTPYFVIIYRVLWPDWRRLLIWPVLVLVSHVRLTSLFSWAIHNYGLSDGARHMNY